MAFTGATLPFKGSETLKSSLKPYPFLSPHYDEQWRKRDSCGKTEHSRNETCCCAKLSPRVLLEVGRGCTRSAAPRRKASSNSTQYDTALFGLHRPTVATQTSHPSLQDMHVGCLYQTQFIAGKTAWSLYVPPGLTFNNSTFCPHTVFMCFVWISEQTAIISLHSIN
jgi:hypothetical protein